MNFDEDHDHDGDVPIGRKSRISGLDLACLKGQGHWGCDGRTPIDAVEMSSYSSTYLQIDMPATTITRWFPSYNSRTFRSF